MNTQLSQSVIDRIDQLLAHDPACDTALAAFYHLWGKLERVDRELHGELDTAWVDVLCAIREACWRDGWNCGRNPDLLVLVPAEPEPEPTPFEWITVPGAEGVAIALTADQVVGRILGGAQ